MRVECPTCHGAGEHDFRDGDALVSELMEFPPPPLGVMECPDCAGTGRMEEGQARDLRAAAVAFVDQALAKLRHEGRLL